jgi:hypothetical protein
MVVQLSFQEDPKFDLNLKVNGKTSSKLRINGPAKFTITMENTKAASAAEYNAPFYQQIEDLENEFEKEQIEEEEFKEKKLDIEKKIKKVKVYQFGGPSGWTEFIEFQILTKDKWEALNWPLKLIKYEPEDDVILLDGTSKSCAEFELDLKNMKKPGEHRIKSVVKLSDDQILESKAVTINIEEEKTEKEK